MPIASRLVPRAARRRAVAPLAVLAALLPGSRPARAQAPAPAVDAPDKLLAAADDITRQVVALRGLETRRPVLKGVLGREAIGQKLRERIAKEYSREEVRTESRVLKRLGLIPESSDYEKLIVDVLMEQVAGFYDPTARKLWIADWLGVDLQRPALAHEIEHALQDQHFDLKQLTAPLKDDGDRQLARSALLEGDGTVVMLEFVAQEQRMDLSRLPELAGRLGKQLQASTQAESPSLSHAPRFLRETLLFPYAAGLDFVVALRSGHPWKRVDEAFRNPPDSTEQVLHPEKFIVRERPQTITPAPIEALGGRKELRRDVLGELEWKVLLASRIPDGTAEQAAAGWGGDRLVAYGAAEAPAGEDDLVVVDLATWDTVEDAEEAEQATAAMLARLVEAKEGKEPKAAAKATPDAGVKPPASATVYGRGKLAWSVERRDDRVLVLFAVPSEKRQAVADEVWAKWKVAPVGHKAAASEKVVAPPAKAVEKKGAASGAKPATKPAAKPAAAPAKKPAPTK
jgi:hypothetical protein